MKKNQDWPQSIKTAPKDGTFILTDVGIAMFFHQDAMPGMGEISGWYTQKFEGASYGLNPKSWQPLPGFISNDGLNTRGWQ